MRETLLQMIRSGRPDVEAIDEIRSFRPTYRFFPALLTLRLRGGDTVNEVLKTGESRESLEFELAVLGALREIGLPVPRICGPLMEVHVEEKVFWGMLLQKIEGDPPDWLGLDNLSSADTSCRLVLTGVARLHRLTEQVLRHPISAAIPKRTLADEFHSLKTDAGPWLSEAFYLEALRLLEEVISQMAVPLVFSNGDYNPLNFLAKNNEVVGWIDFEEACFEDPHIGFAKFFLWADDSFGWATGTRAGLVERYIFENDIRPSDFYGRVILRGLSSIRLRSVEDPPLFMIGVVTSYTEKLRTMLPLGHRPFQQPSRSVG